MSDNDEPNVMGAGLYLRDLEATRAALEEARRERDEARGNAETRGDRGDYFSKMAEQLGAQVAAERATATKYRGALMFVAGRADHPLTGDVCMCDPCVARRALAAPVETQGGPKPVACWSCGADREDAEMCEHCDAEAARETQGAGTPACDVAGCTKGRGHYHEMDGKTFYYPPTWEPGAKQTPGDATPAPARAVCATWCGRAWKPGQMPAMAFIGPRPGDTNWYCSPACSLAGKALNPAPTTCADCGGEGVVAHSEEFPVADKPCPSCSTPKETR